MERESASRRFIVYLWVLELAGLDRYITAQALLFQRNCCIAEVGVAASLQNKQVA